MVINDSALMQKDPEKVVVEKSLCPRKVGRELNVVSTKERNLNAKKGADVIMRKEGIEGEECTARPKRTKEIEKICLTKSDTLHRKPVKFSSSRHLYTPSYLK